MSNKRTTAINRIAQSTVSVPVDDKPADNSFYGEDVFNTMVMRQYLPKDAAKKLLATIEDRAPFDPELAADVAHAE